MKKLVSISISAVVAIAMVSMFTSVTPNSQVAGIIPPDPDTIKVVETIPPNPNFIVIPKWWS